MLLFLKHRNLFLISKFLFNNKALNLLIANSCLDTQLYSVVLLLSLNLEKFNLF